MRHQMGCCSVHAHSVRACLHAVASSVLGLIALQLPIKQLLLSKQHYQPRACPPHVHRSRLRSRLRCWSSWRSSRGSALGCHPMCSSRCCPHFGAYCSSASEHPTPLLMTKRCWREIRWQLLGMEWQPLRLLQTLARLNAAAATCGHARLHIADINLHS